MNDRFRSALLGTALGDAWGYPYENEETPQCTPLPENLIVSDDTLMTLALSSAMRKIDSEDLNRKAGMALIGEKFLDYYKDPDYDRSSGTATTESLDRLDDMGATHWEACSSHSNGAAAIMRASASALLAPSDQGVGWSVLQAIITHDSGIARSSAATMATLMLAPQGADLFDIAEGLAGDSHFDQDVILSDREKSEILNNIDSAVIRKLHGPAVPMTEIYARLREVRKFLTPHLQSGNFEELYAHRNKFVKIFGKSYDAASCTASALLLAQLYLDHKDQFAPHDFLHVAVSWPGNRNTRAAVTGAMIGAHLDSPDIWEQDCTYTFEDRYNEAIHTGAWRGFKQTRSACTSLSNQDASHAVPASESR